MDIGTPFFFVISVIAAFISVSLGCFLFFMKSRYNKANLYLGLLIFTYALFFIPGFFDALGILDKVSFVIRLNFFAGVLVGPFTYLYCKSSIKKEPLKPKEIFPHFIPFIPTVIYFLPFLSKSSDEKITIYHEIITTGQVEGEPKLVIIGMGIYTIIYTILSIRIVFIYLRHLKNTSSSIDASFHRWLMFLSCSLLFPIFMVILITVTDSTVISVPASLLSLASFIFIIYITFISEPKFFHDFPHQIDSRIEDTEEKEKYQNSNLQEHQKEGYQDKLIQYMKQKKPFLNSELTIAEFSDQLKIPAHYISQIINQELGCNFLDFVNRYRIEETKKKLRDASLSHYTILALAFDSGFNSKTAFYAAFKKNVGSTPSQFRKKALENLKDLNKML